MIGSFTCFYSQKKSIVSDCEKHQISFLVMFSHRVSSSHEKQAHQKVSSHLPLNMASPTAPPSRAAQLTPEVMFQFHSPGGVSLSKVETHDSSPLHLKLFSLKLSCTNQEGESSHDSVVTSQSGKINNLQPHHPQIVSLFDLQGGLAHVVRDFKC